MAFYDGVTALVYKGKAMDVTYLDLCKAFDTVPHDILAFKLKKHGCDGWTTWWIRNWLDGHTERVSCGQWLDVQVESSDMWCSSGVTIGIGVKIFASNMDSGIKFILSKLAVLVSAGIELTVFLVAGTVLCFEFSM